jgi:hypothetical protein
MRRLSGQGLLSCCDSGLIKDVPMDPVAFLIDRVWDGSQHPQDGFCAGQGDFPLALGSHLLAILDQLAIERLTVDLQEVGRLGFLPLSPLQSEQDIFTFEVRQGAPAHQGGL